MKITLELPNEMVCAFVGYVFFDSNCNYSMGVSSLDTADLKDGNVIKVPRKEGKE